MHSFDWKLQAYRVKVLSNLRTSFSLSKDCVGFLHCFRIGNDHRMRIPRVWVFNDEFRMDSFDNPMVHKIYPDIALNIFVARHNQRDLELSVWIWLVHLGLFQRAGPSLVSSRVVQSCICKRFPLIFLLIVLIKVSRTVVQEHMVLRLKHF